MQPFLPSRWVIMPDGTKLLSRETVYQALFGLVSPLLAAGAISGPPDGSPTTAGVSPAPGSPSAQTPFNLISREVIEVQRVPPALQPVLFMDEALEEYVDNGAGLYHRRWTVYFHIGCTSAKGTPASSILNPLIDVVEAALWPGEGDLLGLGDFIAKAQLMGVSAKNLGNNSLIPDQRQAVAYIPFQLNFAVF